MKFYKITENIIVQLNVIQVAKRVCSDIYIRYPGVDEAYKISFRCTEDAEVAFDKLCEELSKI